MTDGCFQVGGTMSESKTPRTDGLIGTFYLRCDDCPQPDKCEKAKFLSVEDAIQLETALAAALGELERYKRIQCEAGDTLGSRLDEWERAETAERERDEVNHLLSVQADNIRALRERAEQAERRLEAANAAIRDCPGLTGDYSFNWPEKHAAAIAVAQRKEGGDE